MKDPHKRIPKAPFLEPGMGEELLVECLEAAIPHRQFTFTQISSDSCMQGKAGHHFLTHT